MMASCAHRAGLSWTPPAACAAHFRWVDPAEGGGIHVPPGMQKATALRIAQRAVASGSGYGVRTRVSALRGQYPRPLDESAAF
jgi:hypothetical protein